MRGPLPAATKRGPLPRRPLALAERTGDALPALRISWRDALLDDLARVLGRNRKTADLGRRLVHYLKDARRVRGGAVTTTTMYAHLTTRRQREKLAEYFK